jgi:hypothetical protein
MSSDIGWYDTNPDLSQFYQGDILRDVPFPTWPMYFAENETMAILRPLKPDRPNLNSLPLSYRAQARSSASDAFCSADKGERVVAQCRLRTVMILTRGCQLDHIKKRKHVIVAPVITVSELSEPQIAGLRDNGIPHLFHLPAGEHLVESFADLLKITAIHRSFLHDQDVKGQLIARLSSLGTMRLQHSLSEHLGQKFGFDCGDECPQDGAYRCSTCFHEGRTVSEHQHKKGSIFGACENCGEKAAFVKMP